jgi:hypothetical protein
VISALGKSLSHRCAGKSGLTVARPALKCSLNVLIALSAALVRLQWGGDELIAHFFFREIFF